MNEWMNEWMWKIINVAPGPSLELTSQVLVMSQLCGSEKKPGKEWTEVIISKHILNIVKGCMCWDPQIKPLIVDFKINSELNTVPHNSLVFIPQCKDSQGTRLWATIGQSQTLRLVWYWGASLPSFGCKGWRDIRQPRSPSKPPYNGRHGLVQRGQLPHPPEVRVGGLKTIGGHEWSLPSSRTSQGIVPILYLLWNFSSLDCSGGMRKTQRHWWLMSR